MALFVEMRPVLLAAFKFQCLVLAIMNVFSDVMCMLELPQEYTCINN